MKTANVAFAHTYGLKAFRKKVAGKSKSVENRKYDDCHWRIQRMAKTRTVKEETMDRRRFIESLTLGAIAATTVGLEAHAAPKERHPMIRKAIAALRGAKNELEHADTDFGG